MKLKKTTKVSLRIILLFCTAMVLSFVPEHFTEFFGDQACNGTILNLETGKREYFYHYGTLHHDIEYHWGYRHWLFFLMGLCLAGVQIVDIIFMISNTTEQ